MNAIRAGSISALGVDQDLVDHRDCAVAPDLKQEDLARGGDPARERRDVHLMGDQDGRPIDPPEIGDRLEVWRQTPQQPDHFEITLALSLQPAARTYPIGRYVTFQLAEVAVTRSLFQKILSLIDDLRRRPAPA